MNLLTERLRIRDFTPDDAYSVYEYLKLKEVAGPLCMDRTETIDDAKMAVNEWIAEGRRFALTLRENGAVIGHISVNEDSEEGRDDTRELGFALNPAYQHKGYMTEACTAMMDYLFNVVGLRYLWACCFADNEPSRRVIDRCGFKYMNTGLLYDEENNVEKPSYECLRSGNNLIIKESEDEKVYFTSSVIFFDFLCN